MFRVRPEEKGEQVRSGIFVVASASNGKESRLLGWDCIIAHLLKKRLQISEIVVSQLRLLLDKPGAAPRGTRSETNRSRRWSFATLPRAWAVRRNLARNERSGQRLAACSNFRWTEIGRAS